MANGKKTYYVSIGTGEISTQRTNSTGNFKIEATDEEISTLRQFFDQKYSNEWQTFFRAHVPFVPYHYDNENDLYDETLKEIYNMIYQLGDEEAKQHIETLGILHD